MLPSRPSSETTVHNYYKRSIIVSSRILRLGGLSFLNVVVVYLLTLQAVDRFIDIICQGFELFNLAEQEIFRDNEFSYMNRLITFTNINKFKKNNECRICVWTLAFPLNPITLRYTIIVFCLVFGVLCEDFIWFENDN